MLKKFFQTVDVKRGNFNKTTHVEIFKIHENLLSSVLCFVRMSCQILFTVFFWCNDLKRFIIPEHTRCGVENIFMISEPLAGRRETVVTETRNAIDFANILKYTSDVLYSRAEKIILVTDNLNTHAASSLYKAFRPDEACRLAQRFEWHYTLKHGSWLDMTEIEIGILSRQALAKPLPDLESIKKQVRIWTVKRNEECKKINWQFTTSDARIKLDRLYPSML